MRYSLSFCALLFLTSHIAFSEIFFVKLPDRTVTVDMDLGNDVEALHDYLEPISGLPKELLFLTLNGRPLDARTNPRLKDINLKSEMTIFASVKNLCCVRCNPIDAMRNLFTAILHCITTTFFMDPAVTSDLCDCTDLPTYDETL